MYLVTQPFSGMIDSRLHAKYAGLYDCLLRFMTFLQPAVLHTYCFMFIESRLLWRVASLGPLEALA